MPARDALNGRVVLVTGAHGGLGQAAALACARAGATVVLLGRKVPKLESRLRRIVGDGGRGRCCIRSTWQAHRPTTTRRWPSAIEAELGRLDGVLHCAARIPRPDAAAAHRSGGIRARAARQPHRALVADPGLPAAVVEGGRCRRGVRARRPAADAAGVLGRLWRRQARAAALVGDAPRRNRQRAGSRQRIAAGADAHRPAAHGLRRGRRPRRARSGGLRRCLRDLAVAGGRGHRGEVCATVRGTPAS